MHHRRMDIRAMQSFWRKLITRGTNARAYIRWADKHCYAVIVRKMLFV